MTARAGMANLILELRALTQTTETDYTVNGVQYWTDDQLQSRLDDLRTDWRRVELIPAPEVTAGNVFKWYDYGIPSAVGKFFEEQASDSIWAVKDNTGATKTITTDYTVNYSAQMIRFVNDQLGYAFWLDCRTFPLYEVAARIWLEKAAQVSGGVDWSSDNHSIKGSQEIEHYILMAKEMRKRGGSLKVSKFVRTDEVRGGW
mgnify:CR=1 FL=1